MQAEYVFLHKNFFGSILAISDEAGNALEQRHYDAWANTRSPEFATSEGMVKYKILYI